MTGALCTRLSFSDRGAWSGSRSMLDFRQQIWTIGRNHICRHLLGYNNKIKATIKDFNYFAIVLSIPSFFGLFRERFFSVLGALGELVELSGVELSGKNTESGRPNHCENHERYELGTLTQRQSWLAQLVAVDLRVFVEIIRTDGRDKNR